MYKSKLLRYFHLNFSLQKLSKKNFNFEGTFFWEKVPSFCNWITQKDYKKRSSKKGIARYAGWVKKQDYHCFGQKFQNFKA